MSDNKNLPSLNFLKLNNFFGIDFDAYDVLKKHLDKLSQDEKVKVIDAILGIEGGHHLKEELANDIKNNWLNWVNGDYYNKELSPIVLNKHSELTEEQIRHVIRHGTPEEKWAVFTNPNVNHHYQNEIYDLLKKQNKPGWSREDFKYVVIVDAARNIPQEFILNTVKKIKKVYPIESFVRESKDLDSDKNAQILVAGITKEDYENDKERSEVHPWDEFIKFKMTSPHSQSVWREYYDVVLGLAVNRIKSDLHQRAENWFDDPIFFRPFLEKIIPELYLLFKKHKKESLQICKEGMLLDNIVHKSTLKAFLNKKITEFKYFPDLFYYMLINYEISRTNGWYVSIYYMKKKYPSLTQHWDRIFGFNEILTIDDLHNFILKSQESAKTYQFGFAAENDDILVNMFYSQEVEEYLLENSEAYDIVSKLKSYFFQDFPVCNLCVAATAKIELSPTFEWTVAYVNSDINNKILEAANDNLPLEEREAIQKLVSMLQDYKEILLAFVLLLAKENEVCGLNLQNIDNIGYLEGQNLPSLSLEKNLLKAEGLKKRNDSQSDGGAEPKPSLKLPDNLQDLSSHIKNSDKETQYKIAAASIPHYYHESIVHDFDEGPKRHYLSNQKFSPETQERLSQKLTESSHKAALALNPHLHPDIQFKLAGDDSSQVKQGLSYNKSLHPLVQNFLIREHWNNPKVRAGLVNNPNLKLDMPNLKKIVHHENTEIHILHDLINHPNLSDEGLDYIAQNHHDHRIKEAAKNKLQERLKARQNV